MFLELGGMKELGKALKRGMVMVMTLWDDGTNHMQSYDGDWPLDWDRNLPGV